MRYLKHIVFFCAGLFYSLILTVTGLIYTGMGHGTDANTTSVFWLLALLPVPLIYWAVVGVLLCWVRLRTVRIVVVCLVVIHYLAFIICSYTGLMGSSYEGFSAVWRRDPGGIIFTILFYLLGQIVIWSLLIFSKETEVS